MKVQPCTLPEIVFSMKVQPCTLPEIVFSTFMQPCISKVNVSNLYPKEKRLAGNEPFLFWNSMNAFVDTLSCFIN
jgi:hypothetical protein